MAYQAPGRFLFHSTINGEAKPGWLVDGQQRALALSRSRRKDFPVPVCAFITDDVEIQRDQFLRINNSRPLPRGLVTELLPEVSSPLPANMALRKMPAAICDLLNREKASPFKGLIRRPSTQRKEECCCLRYSDRKNDRGEPYPYLGLSFSVSQCRDRRV